MTVQLTGGGFQDSTGKVLANGTIKLELSQDANTSSGEVCAGYTVTIQLDANGNVVTSPSQVVWPNDQLIPTNTFYTVTAYSAAGQLVWGPNAQRILSTPSPFNIGAWIPAIVNINANLDDIALQTNGVNNGSQVKLNLVQGSNVTISDDGNGDITISSTGGGGGGSGTVTSVSVANANGVSATVTNPNTTPNLTFTLGAISPSSLRFGGAGSTLSSVMGPSGIAATFTGAPVTGNVAVVNASGDLIGTDTLNGVNLNGCPMQNTDINLNGTSLNPINFSNVLYWNTGVGSNSIHFGKPSSLPTATGFYSNANNQFMVDDNSGYLHVTATDVEFGGNPLLATTGAVTPSTSTVDNSIPVVIGGVTWYLALKSAP